MSLPSLARVSREASARIGSRNARLPKKGWSRSATPARRTNISPVLPYDRETTAFRFSTVRLEIVCSLAIARSVPLAPPAPTARLHTVSAAQAADMKPERIGAHERQERKLEMHPGWKKLYIKYSMLERISADLTSCVVVGRNMVLCGSVRRRPGLSPPTPPGLSCRPSASVGSAATELVPNKLAVARRGRCRVVELLLRKLVRGPRSNSFTEEADFRRLVARRLCTRPTVPRFPSPADVISFQRDAS